MTDRPHGGHPGSAPVPEMPKVTTAPATGARAPELFAEQQRNYDRAVRANLASLNEIIYELVAAVSPDPEWVAMVEGVLREHTHAIGYEFREEHDR